VGWSRSDFAKKNSESKNKSTDLCVGGLVCPAVYSVTREQTRRTGGQDENKDGATAAG